MTSRLRSWSSAALGLLVALACAALIPATAWAAALTGTSVTQGTYQVQGAGSVSVGFTTATPVPADGSVTVRFPADYDLTTMDTGVNAAVFGGAVPFDGDNRVTVDFVTNTVTVARTGGGTETAAGAKLVTFSAVTNPESASASPGAFSIATANSAGSELDSGTAAAPAIFAGGLPDASIRLGSSATSATTDVTVGFDAEQSVPANGKIVITFPADFNVSAVGTTATFGGAVPFDGTGSVSVSGQTVTVTRSGGSASTAGAKTVVLSNVVNPATARLSSGSFAISTTNGSGGVIDEGGATGPAIAPAALTSLSTTVAMPEVGETGSVSFAFTTPGVTPADGRVTILMPAGFDLSGLGTTAAFSGAVPFTGTGTVTTNGQLITIQRSGGTATALGAKVVTLTGIRNPGHVGLFAPVVISTADTAGALIASGTTSATITTPGDLTTLEVDPASLTVSATGEVSVGFTTANMVPGDGVIRISMPAGFVLSGVGVNPVFPTNPSTNFDGTATLSVSGSDLIITRNGDGADSPSGAKRITLTGVQNPPSAGTTGTFAIQTTTRAGDQIDIGTAPGIDIAAGAVTAATVTPASLLTAASGNATVAFTTAHEIPANGRIVVTFPSDFVVSGATTATSPTGLDGTLAVTTSGQSVVITRSGGTAAAAGTKSFVLNNIVNPIYMGTTGTFGIRTESGAAGFPDIDSGSAPGVEITPNSAGGSATFTTDVAGSLSTMTLTWATGGNSVDADGRIVVTLPTGFDVSRVGQVGLSGIDGAFTTTLNAGSRTVTVVRTTGGTAASGTLAITIPRLRLPQVSGPTAAITLQTQTAAAAAEENVTAEGLLVEPSVLRSLAAAPAATGGSTVAGATGNFTVSFDTSNPIPADGEIAIAFPDGMDVSEVGSAPVSMTGIDGAASVSFDAASRSVTITRTTGGTASATGAKSVTLSGIGNQPYVGPVGSIAIGTASAAGAMIDQGTVAAPYQTVAGPVVAIAFEGDYPIAGQVNDVAMEFTTTNAIPEGGELLLALPAGFSVPDPDAVNIYTDDPTLGQASWELIGGRSFLITRNDIGGPSPAGDKLIAITGIRNPTRSGVTDPLTIETGTASDQLIDAGQSATGTIILPAVSDGTTATPGSLAAGDLTSVEFALTSPLSVPAGGRFEVTFPTGFDLSRVGTTATTSFTGTNQVTTSGQTVLVQRTGGAAIPAGTPITLSIPRVTNPGVSGLTGDFLVDVQDSDGDPLDLALADGVTMTAGAMRLVSATPANSRAGALGDLAVGFTNTNPIPGNGQVTIAFPAGFDLSQVGAAVSATGLDGTSVARVDAATRTVTVTRSGGSSAGPGAKSLVLSGVRNPSATGAAGRLAVASSTASGLAIDEGATASAFTVTAAVATEGLRTAGLAFATLSPRGRGSVVVTVQTVNPLDNGADVVVTFPAGFDVSQVGATAKYGGAVPFDGTNFVSASGQQVTIARTGGTTTGPGTKTITLTSVGNPTAVGRTGAFPITIVDARGALMETGTASPVNIQRPARLVSPIRRTVTRSAVILTTRVRFSERIPSSLIVRPSARPKSRVMQLPGTRIGNRVVARPQEASTIRPTRAGQVVNLTLRLPRNTRNVQLQLVATTGNVKQTLTLRR